MSITPLYLGCMGEGYKDMKMRACHLRWRNCRDNSSGWSLPCILIVIYYPATWRRAKQRERERQKDTFKFSFILHNIINIACWTCFCIIYRILEGISHPLSLCDLKGMGVRECKSAWMRTSDLSEWRRRRWVFLRKIIYNVCRKKLKTKGNALLCMDYTQNGAADRVKQR